MVQDLNQGVLQRNKGQESRQTAIAFTGGGTAGHVLPNQAIFESNQTALGDQIAQGQVSAYYIGSRDGIENKLLADSQRLSSYIPISAGKLRRYFSWQNFLSPFQVIAGFFQARSALKKHCIKALFSKGGFVSAPVVWAAWTLGIPVIIHESDFSPALTTKLTQPFATAIFTAFQETIKQMSPSSATKAKAIGIPLRDELFHSDREAAIKHFTLNENLPTLLVFGGSLGALALNNLTREILPTLDAKANVIHLTGRGKSFDTEGLTHYRQFEYLDKDMHLALAAADCAFCRAGASSIFELAALRIPMLLLPLGLNQSRGDQIENAHYFKERGWATVLDETKATPEQTLSMVTDMLTNLDVRKAKLASAPSTDALNEVSHTLLSFCNGTAQ